MELEELLALLREIPPWMAYVALFAGAFGEYVFPPVPGDLIVLAGAVLVAVFGWPVVPVFLLVTAGSVLGAMVDYGFGRWLQRTGRIERLSGRKQLAIRYVLGQFERYGSVYLVINRMVPGIRAFFFIAAGLAKLPVLWVALWGTLASVFWNAVLFAVGYGFGSNLEALERFVMRNGAIVAVLVALGLSVMAWRMWRAVNAASPGRIEV